MFDENVGAKRLRFFSLSAPSLTILAISPFLFSLKMICFFLLFFNLKYIRFVSFLCHLTIECAQFEIQLYDFCCRMKYAATGKKKSQINCTYEL